MLCRALPCRWEGEVKVQMADPDAGVGFGYVMNKMSMGLVGGPTGFAVLKAFYEAL